MKKKKKYLYEGMAFNIMYLDYEILILESTKLIFKFNSCIDFINIGVSA